MNEPTQQPAERSCFCTTVVLQIFTTDAPIEFDSLAEIDRAVGNRTAQYMISSTEIDRITPDGLQNACAIYALDADCLLEDDEDDAEQIRVYLQSRELGSETFPYDTRDEAEAAWKRLCTSADTETARDGIIRRVFCPAIHTYHTTTAAPTSPTIVPAF